MKMKHRIGFSVTVDVFHEQYTPGGSRLLISLHCHLCNRVVMSWPPPTALAEIEEEADRHAVVDAQNRARNASTRTAKVEKKKP
jgi:hypothetical protein